MPHPLSGRGCLTGHESRHRFRHVFRDVTGGPLLVLASDFTDEHYCFRLAIGLEKLQRLQEVQTNHLVAADTHASALPQVSPGEVVDDLVSQGAAAGHNTHRSFLVDRSRHDPDLGFARGYDTGAVTTHQTGVAADKETAYFHHLVNGNALRDTYHQFQTTVRGLHDGVSGGKGRNEDD